MFVSQSTVDDSNAPVISNCPQDSTYQLPLNKTHVQITWNEPSATDDVTPATLIKQTQSHTSGQKFPTGTTNVIYTFSDEAGNTGVCNFNIMVTRKCMWGKSLYIF